MRFLLFRAIGFVVCSTISCCCYSQDIVSKPLAGSAVPFLQIASDARAAGMGDMGQAIPPDAATPFYNVAKAAFGTGKAAVSANYTSWMKRVSDDTYLAALSGFYKLSETEALTASLRYFNMGSADIVDFNGNKQQEAHPREYAVDLGYARRLAEKLSLGLSLRYISSELTTGTFNGSDYKKGTAVAADVSVYYNGINNVGTGLTAGVSLANLGTKIGYTSNNQVKDFLPATLSAGIAFKKSWEEDHHITAGVEVTKLLVPLSPITAGEAEAYYNKTVLSGIATGFGNSAFHWGSGAEYNYNEQLYLRAGYRAQTNAAGGLRYITTGLGVHFYSVMLNFSYLLPAGNAGSNYALEHNLRLGASFSFN